MADLYRSLPQWQALNRIWKAVPPSAREGVKEDFRVITEWIRAQADEKAAQKAPEAPAPVRRDFSQDENYLKGLSPEARRLALNALTREGKNLYTDMMRLIESARVENGEQLWDAWVSQRDVEEGEEAPLREIMEMCLSRSVKA